MFKVICNIKLSTLQSYTQDQRIAPAVQKYEQIIRYYNCSLCDVGGLKLTNTSATLGSNEILAFLMSWSSNFLNPINPSYYLAYDDILEKAAQHSFDVSNFRFVGIFERDNGIHQQIEGFVFTNVYEAIIDINSPKSLYNIYHIDSSKRVYKAYTTGYETYHQKISLLSVNTERDTVSTGKIFKTAKNGKKYIDISVIACLLRGQDTLQCKMLSDEHKINDLEPCINFLKKDIIGRLKIDMDSLQEDITVCDIGGEYRVLNMHDAPRAVANPTIDLCKAIGVKRISAKTQIEIECKASNPEHVVGAYTSSVLKITCADYHSFIDFDENGEIIGVKMSLDDILEQQITEQYNL